MKEIKEPKTFKIGKWGWSSRRNLWYFKCHYNKNSYIPIKVIKLTLLGFEVNYRLLYKT